MAVSPPTASGLSPNFPNTPQPSKWSGRKKAPLLLAIPVIAFCLAVIGGVGYWVVYPQLRAGYRWREAKKALENNDLARAEEHLTSCVQVWAKDGEVQFLLARTYRRLGRFDRARVHLQLALKQHWVTEQIKLEKLLIKAQIAYLPETARLLREELRQGHKDETHILEALIVGGLQTHNHVEANRWTTIWIEQHPDDWLGRYWRGVALEEAGEFDSAAKEYQKAYQLNPNGWELHLRLAEALMRANPSEDAMGHYEAVLRDDPKNTVALLGLARCQHSLRTNEIAKATLAELMEVDPHNFGAYSLQGKMAMEEDNLEGALNALRKAQDINPHHLATSSQLVLVLRMLKHDDEAIQFERRTRELEKDLVRLNEISKELVQRPNDVSLRDEAGSIHLKLGDVQEALRWFISALVIDFKHRPTRDYLKKCLQQLDDKELLEQYQLIIEDQP